MFSLARRYTVYVKITSVSKHKMDRKFFKRLLKKLHPVNPWVFLVIAIVSGIISVTALRNNNVTALKLRDKVIAADKNNTDVEKPLRDLREYIYAHMNTDLSVGEGAIKPPIQLKYRYERLVAAENERVGKENEKIYNDAQVECEKRFPKGLSGSGRIPCIKEYIEGHGIQEKTIPDNLYKFDFVSPKWSPDLAGWSLVVSSISFALFVIRFGMDRWVQTELRDLT